MQLNMIMMVVYNHGIQPVSPNEQNKVLVSKHIKIDEMFLKAYYMSSDWVYLVVKRDHLVEGPWRRKIPLGVNRSPGPRMPIYINY